MGEHRGREGDYPPPPLATRHTAAFLPLGGLWGQTWAEEQTLMEMIKKRQVAASLTPTSDGAPGLKPEENAPKIRAGQYSAPLGVVESSK